MEIDRAAEHPESALLLAVECQRAFMAELVCRADALRTRRTQPGADNMLVVCGDGRKVALEIEARDTLDTICKGRHERFIVDVEQTRQRLLKKAAKAQES